MQCPSQEIHAVIEPVNHLAQIAWYPEGYC